MILNTRTPIWKLFWLKKKKVELYFLKKTKTFAFGDFKVHSSFFLVYKRLNRKWLLINVSNVFSVSSLTPDWKRSLLDKWDFKIKCLQFNCLQAHQTKKRKRLSPPPPSSPPPRHPLLTLPSPPRPCWPLTSPPAHSGAGAPAWSPDERDPGGQELLAQQDSGLPEELRLVLLLLFVPDAVLPKGGSGLGARPPVHPSLCPSVRLSPFVLHEMQWRGQDLKWKKQAAVNAVFLFLRQADVCLAFNAVQHRKVESSVEPPIGLNSWSKRMPLCADCIPTQWLDVATAE